MAFSKADSANVRHGWTADIIRRVSIYAITLKRSQSTALDYRAGDSEHCRCGGCFDLDLGIGPADLEGQNWMASSMADADFAPTVDRTRDLGWSSLAFALWASNRISCRSFRDGRARLDYWLERLRHREGEGGSDARLRSCAFEQLVLLCCSSHFGNGDHGILAVIYRMLLVVKMSAMGRKRMAVGGGNQTLGFLPSCMSPCRKHVVWWSFTMPTACMKA